MYAAPYIGRPVGVGTVGLAFYDPPRFNLAESWNMYKEINLGTIQPGQIKPLYHTVFIPFNVSSDRNINWTTFMIDIDWPSGFVRYSLEIDFDKGVPILKSVDIRDNYKSVKIDDYLEFNKYANMDQFFKQYEKRP